MEAFMNSNRLVLDAEQDDKLNILSLAALFQGDFSLDWLQYLLYPRQLDSRYSIQTL